MSVTKAFLSKFLIAWQIALILGERFLSFYNAYIVKLFIVMIFFILIVIFSRYEVFEPSNNDWGSQMPNGHGRE